MMLSVSQFAQTKAKPKSKKKYHSTSVKKKTVPVHIVSKKLPLNLFIKLVDSTETFVINHATEFQHIDLPKKNFDMFNSYIKDSAAVEVTGLKSLIYYNYTMPDGQIFIGDIFWNEKSSYIVFKIYDKKYVNYFSREGVQQLKSLFKL
jgi:hypothetical protein